MTAMIAVDSGSTMLKKNLVFEQPSISAASRSSSGMLVWKNVRLMMMFVMDVAPRITMTSGLLYKPRLLTVRNVGIKPPEKNIVNRNIFVKKVPAHKILAGERVRRRQRQPPGSRRCRPPYR